MSTQHVFPLRPQSARMLAQARAAHVQAEADYRARIEATVASFGHDTAKVVALELDTDPPRIIVEVPDHTEESILQEPEGEP